MTNERYDPQPRRRTIGFLIDWIGGRYHSQLWPGLADLAHQRGFNLVIFSGGSLYSPHGYLEQRNAVYDLVGPQCVDGLVVVSGSLSQYITQQEFAAFYNRFTALPMVSIAQRLPGIPSVLVDNSKGMRDVVTHLIEVHGRQRIAFVRGPEGHEEAEERFAAYREALEAHGIPFDPNLVAPGEFIHESGEDAVRLFLDERQVTFDAVVAVDDDTALGVINELQARGIRMPGEVAVTGFDDVDEARYLAPSLTTVRQPFYEQARIAGELLLDLLDGKAVPEQVHLPASMVARHSCGCTSEAILRAGARLELGIPQARLSEQERYEYTRGHVSQAIAACLVRDADVQQCTEWAGLLLTEFIAAVDEGGAGQFLAALESLLQQTTGLIHFSAWQDVITALRQGLWAYMPEQAARPQAETWLGQARVLIAEAAEHLQAFRVLQYQQRSLVVDESGQSLLTTLEMDELVQVIGETLSGVGISSTYLALYDASTREHASLLLALEAGGLRPFHEAAPSYPAKRLIPEGLLPVERMFVWVIEALYFQSEQLGYIIFEAGPKDGILYAALRRQISSALKGALLLRERKQAEQALKSAYQELESFSYSVSHDLRTPLRAIQGYSTLLRSSLGEELKDDNRLVLEHILSATRGMNDKIEALLVFSRASRGELKPVLLDLSQAAEAVIGQLRAGEPARQVETNILPGITAVADTALMRTVVENLLGNAWKYSARNPQAKITFGTQEMDGRQVYFVQDNGVGFDMRYAHKLFAPFQRMHRTDEFEGLGIGLATVQRIIRRHGGEIWCEAAVEQGATFYFTLL